MVVKVITTILMTMISHKTPSGISSMSCGSVVLSCTSGTSCPWTTYTVRHPDHASRGESQTGMMIMMMMMMVVVVVMVLIMMITAATAAQKETTRSPPRATSA